MQSISFYMLKSVIRESKITSAHVCGLGEKAVYAHSKN